MDNDRRLPDIWMTEIKALCPVQHGNNRDLVSFAAQCCGNQSEGAGRDDELKAESLYAQL